MKKPNRVVVSRSSPWPSGVAGMCAGFGRLQMTWPVPDIEPLLRKSSWKTQRRRSAAEMVGRDGMLISTYTHTHREISKYIAIE